jgi:hypothetical protein
VKAAEEQAERAKQRAEEASRARERSEREGRGRSSVSGANVASPGVGSTSDPNAAAAAARGATAGAYEAPGGPGSASDRPEVVIGAAFVGSFLVARILKRIFD